MKTTYRIFKGTGLKQFNWCKAVNNKHFFLGWNENSIHINIPLLIMALCISISKNK